MGHFLRMLLLKLLKIENIDLKIVSIISLYKWIIIIYNNLLIQKARNFAHFVRLKNYYFSEIGKIKQMELLIICHIFLEENKIKKKFFTAKKPKFFTYYSFY